MGLLSGLCCSDMCIVSTTPPCSSCSLGEHSHVIIMQDAQSQQLFILDQLGIQARSAADAAMAVPQRVERMNTTLASLEGGDLKLRVRALEVERAARRASVMQVRVITVSLTCLMVKNAPCKILQRLSCFPTCLLH